MNKKCLIVLVTVLIILVNLTPLFDNEIIVNGTIEKRPIITEDVECRIDETHLSSKSIEERVNYYEDIINDTIKSPVKIYYGH